MTFDAGTWFFIIVSLAMVAIGRKAWQWKAGWDSAAVITKGRR
jgi:hypothetical protein